jgi:hypothetical protein
MCLLVSICCARWLVSALFRIFVCGVKRCTFGISSVANWHVRLFVQHFTTEYALIDAQ